MNRFTTSSPSTAGYIGDWIEPLARVGYGTKGVVYAIVGLLAVQAALNTGESAEGTRGAILSVADEPFGIFLIGLAAVGLFAYALWRFVQALLDPGYEGTDAKGLAKRIGYAVSGLTYLGLAVWSAWIVLGRSGATSGGGTASSTAAPSGGGSSSQEWTATLMAQPFGRWLVALVGAIIVAVGLFHFYRAIRGTYLRRYRVNRMSPGQRKWVTRIGAFGLTARGVAFCVIGGFLLQAALQADPSETRGLSGALEAVEQQPYGPWLLLVVALGFVAYGIHNFALARFGRVRV